ncbi:sigma-70 family RNA polymerase sigma factor [Bacillus mycoides]|uniref:sigma-70 family RNA polymerase sigma factor n=1 Tax=Bacillus mycoides TaxID=1405 RepID=UPI003D661C8D
MKGMESILQELDLEDLYKEYKKYYFSIAYYLLGSIGAAEDIVQDVFVKLIEHEKTNNEITDVKAYINKMVVNRCMNELKSSRKKKESYIGIWLPEPILQELNGEPLERMIQSDQLSYSYLVLMESLSPRERTAYVLRNALGLQHSEISEIIQTTEINSRKILSRAQRKIKSGQSESTSAMPSSLKNEYITQFKYALSNGDIQVITNLLSNDITLTSDGGGQVRAAINVIEGKQRVSALISGIVYKFFLDKMVNIAIVNNQQGIVVTQNGKLTGIFCFGWNSETYKINRIFYVVNPDKLKYTTL